MYQKYQTEALILGNRESGESDRIYTLFTREFGLVRARGSAVRREISRMRYALQNYAHVRVSLVRGRRGWRLAGATAGAGVLTGLRDADLSTGLLAFARISELTIRLIHGEEKNTFLFSVLAETHDALTRVRGRESATIEIVCVARLLYALGYLSVEALETTLFTHTAYMGEHLLEAEVMKDKLLSSINKAIAETHL